MRLVSGRPVGGIKRPDAEEHASEYAVQLTDEAVYALSDIASESLVERIGFLLGNLSRFPRYGSVYDPVYKSAKPPVECRVFYCGPYGVYYHVDDEKHVVAVFAIEDERRDPMGRFSLR